MFLKIGLADDIVPKTHLFVGKNYSKRKQLKKFSEYLFVLDKLLDKLLLKVKKKKKKSIL